MSDTSNDRRWTARSIRAALGAVEAMFLDDSAWPDGVANSDMVEARDVLRGLDRRRAAREASCDSRITEQELDAMADDGRLTRLAMQLAIDAGADWPSLDGEAQDAWHERAIDHLRGVEPTTDYDARRAARPAATKPGHLNQHGAYICGPCSDGNHLGVRHGGTEHALCQCTCDGQHDKYGRQLPARRTTSGTRRSRR